MNTTFNKLKFADRLRKQRLNAGYERQSDLAHAAGISSQAVSAYEAGVRLPSAEVLSSIAQALGCTTDYLVQLENNHKRENASIGQELGLSDVSINNLRNHQIMSTDETHKWAGKRALDLINLLLESDDFDRIIRDYSQLCISIYTQDCLIAEREKCDPGELNDFLLQTVKYGVFPIEPQDAYDFYIHQLRISISDAICAGIQKRLESLGEDEREAF